MLPARLFDSNSNPPGCVLGLGYLKQGGGDPLHPILVPHTLLSLFAPPGSTDEAARIIYPPEAQTIVVTKGQSLILECVASGIPPPRVTWAKDGSSVASYNKTRFLLSNLLIDTTSEEDSGTYRCMADNGVGEPGAAVILYNVQVFGECLLQTSFSLAISYLHSLARSSQAWFRQGYMPFERSHAK